MAWIRSHLIVFVFATLLCWYPTKAMAQVEMSAAGNKSTPQDAPSDILEGSPSVSSSVVDDGESALSTRSLVPFLSALTLTSGTLTAGWITLGMALRAEKDVPDVEIKSMTHESKEERQYHHLMSASRALLPMAAVGLVATITVGMLTFGDKSNHRIGVTAKLRTCHSSSMMVLNARF